MGTDCMRMAERENVKKSIPGHLFAVVTVFSNVLFAEFWRRGTYSIGLLGIVAHSEVSRVWSIDVKKTFKEK